MKDEFEEIDKMTDEELFAEMKSILDEVEEDEKVKDAAVPEESFNVVFSQIREIEERRARENLSKRDKKLLEYGRRYERQLHFRKYWILAAVLVLVLAMGMTSVGGPERLIQKMTKNLSGRQQETVDVGKDNIDVIDEWSEEDAYAAIEEKYGFYPVRLDFLPEGVVFESVEINEERQDIILFYSREEELAIQYVIRPNYRDGSLGIDIEDEMIKEFILQNETIEMTIRVYRVGKEERYTASFILENTAYHLIGFDMEQVVFESILQNMKL